MIDSPNDARAQLEAQARAAAEKHYSECGNYIELTNADIESLAALLVSFARAHGEAQFVAGLEAAMGIADAEAHHWMDFGNYKSTNARADSASNIAKKIRALIDAAQDGKAGE